MIITTNLDPPQTSKQIYRKLKYKEKVFGEFQRLPRFPKKMIVFVNQNWHFKDLNQYSEAHKIRFRLLIDFKKNL